MFDAVNITDMIAEERILAQGYSPLARDLVDCIQELINYKNSIWKPNSVKTKKERTRHFNDVCDDIQIFTIQNTSGRLKSILKKHLNMNVRSVEFTKPDRIVGRFACIPFIPSGVLMETSAIRGMYSGTRAYEEYSKIGNIEGYLEFIQSTSTLDTTKGSFKKTPDKIEFTLYLDTAAIVFINDMHPNLAAFTAKEIAAIILHEIGHQIRFIELSSDLYFKSRAASEILDYKGTDRNFTTTREILLERIAKQTKQAKASSSVNTLPLSPDTLKNGVVGLPMIATVYVLGKIFYHLISLLLHDVVAHSRSNEAIYKKSDVRSTSFNSAYNERIADEFVSVHGLSSQIVSGLHKIYVLFDFEDRQNDPYAHRRSTATKLLMSVLGSMRVFKKQNIYAFLTYEPDIVRMESVVADVYRQLRETSGRDKKLKAYYLEEAKRTREQFKLLKANRKIQLNGYVNKFIYRVSDNGGLYAALLDANIANDYKQLQKMTNGLFSSNLFYHQARLDQLLDD